VLEQGINSGRSGYAPSAVFVKIVIKH